VNVCGAGTTTTLRTVASRSGFNPPSTGLAVSADLTSVGGSNNQAFFDNGTNGDQTAGDGTFSYRATVPAGTTVGSKSIPFTITDAQSRTGAGVIGLTVNGCPTSGPDVTIWDLIDVFNYGSSGNISAFAVGTNACNPGDVPVTWIAGVNQHPVIAQNMFRLKNGRFEQLGQSWLKHGFSSTNSPGCGSCQQPPNGGQQLGTGCTDAYGSGLNGGQGNLGPRSQVNATTGVYPYPFTATPAADPTISRRLQVFTSDIDPAQNAGAQYFVDCHYVTSDDAQWALAGPGGNGLNNCSYRPIASPALTPPATSGGVNFAGATVRFQPAIMAWAAADPTVQVVTADYLDTGVVPTGITSRFYIGCKVSLNPDGTYHYEYAVYNFNADRNGGLFSVPVPAGVTISNIGFHGVFAHSGEPYPNTAANLDNWPGVLSNGRVTWTCPEPYAAPGDNANPIRWGTMYNFRFDANVAPIAGPATVGLFKPATATSTAVSIAGTVKTPGSRCGPGDFNHDGSVSVQDIFDFLAAYFANDLAADFNHAGGLSVQDIFDYLATYFQGCPV
jgi:hypothetical protein